MDKFKFKFRDVISSMISLVLLGIICIAIIIVAGAFKAPFETTPIIVVSTGRAWSVPSPVVPAGEGGLTFQCGGKLHVEKGERVPTPPADVPLIPCE